ncbi:Oidioi.mRNA.OKI2018_I69.XSR.g15323.t1.cds [Oikopleura dioica]|uniref:Oidioi.mRNA.OKI2018_I69.XSR.g15323.t1.cds n=1 Tax=Oikopleura dioica TaxID=34765 RepID=A0ABN7SJX4_OIKDI|nr:Oidioi.mRNA.OKI2018_I69.XSR.g15323.t1.cds [Oikopleura dioica]
MGIQGKIENLTEEQIKRITCSVCLEIYEEPVEVACCRQVFCKKCILAVSGNKGNSCPICRENLDIKRLTKAHPFILEHLSTVEMKCPFPECPESNTYEAHINHISSCSRGPDSVCNSCNQNVPRLDFDDHLENCLQRYKELVKKAEYMITKLRMENRHLREKLTNAERRASMNQTSNYYAPHMLE